MNESAIVAISPTVFELHKLEENTTELYMALMISEFTSSNEVVSTLELWVAT